jgi:hypothetical protein
MTKLSSLGFEFAPLTLENRDTLTEFLRKYPQRLTGYTFASLAAWRPFFHYEWTIAEPDLLLISCIIEPDLRRHLLQPVGLMSPGIAKTLTSGAAKLDYALRLIGISDTFLKANTGFSHSFACHEDRAVSNYLYDAKALARLPGRKYSKKRNLLAQAAGLYRWSCKALDSRTVDQCFAVLDAIIQEEQPQVEGMLQRELAALECTLRHFSDFDQQGLIVSIDGRAVAFSIYEAISPTTVAIHFERALRSYKGLYQVINCETAKIIADQGFHFINREEDLGDAGLRDAKMSYHPVEIIPAYELTYKK